MLQMFRSWLKSTKKVTAAGRHSKHGKSGSKPLGLEVLESRLNPAASLPANYHVVENLYNGLMNRVSDLPGKAYWVRQLDLGASVAVVAREMQDSTEYRRQTVESYYQAFLDRPSDAPGLKAFVSAARSASEEDLIARFVSSQEYSGGPATTPQNYVDTLYQTLLYRQGDETGINSQIAALARGASRYDVAFAMVRSLEFYTGQVVAAYKSTLGRTPSPWESSGWAASLYEGKLSLPGMRAGIYGSAEAFKQLKTPKAFTPDTSVTWKADQIGLTGRESAGLSPALREYVDTTTRTAVYVDASLLMNGLGGTGHFQFPASAIGGQASYEFLPSYYDHGEDGEDPLMPVDSDVATAGDASQASYSVWSSGTPTWPGVYPLPEHVPYSRAAEIVDEATIQPEDILRITPVPPVSQWTRLFDFVERKDLPPVPLNPSAPGPVTGFSLIEGEQEGSLLARWDPPSWSFLPDLGAQAVYTFTVNGGSIVEKFLTADTSIKIKGLQAGVPYTFAVSATNGQHTGPKVEETWTTAACTRCGGGPSMF